MFERKVWIVETALRNSDPTTREWRPIGRGYPTREFARRVARGLRIGSPNLLFWARCYTPKGL